MGLRYVKGLGEGDREKIERERPFASVEDFVRRTGLDEGAVTRLAEAGAFTTLDPSRRGALWSARGAARVPRRGMEMRADERAPRFTELDPFETIGWDYRASGHSALGHPLEPLRDRLRAQRIPDAHEVARMGDGRRVRYAGLVICRQRPGTASGVVFMTLEDESGFVNVVVWAQVYERFKVLVKTASFLGVTGRLQVQDGVVHLIADSFFIPRTEAASPRVGSRDFH